MIKKADLKINESEQNLVSELENLKVFISITDLYKRDIFKIKRAEVKKANIYINNASLKNFIYNLKKNIVNNFILKKSNIFFKNEKDEIILISTIKDLNYKIDFLNNKKIFSINGNIFDADYKFNYLIDDRTKNGADKFEEEHIHFGQGAFKDWNAVTKYLLNKE